MSGTLHYRLVLRDAEDTIDEVTLSSLPADANPYLTAPPEGDGESLDPLTGKVAFAEYVFKVADEVGTLATPNVLFDEQWDYADIAARNAVWVKTSDQAGSYSYTFLASGSDPAETVTGDNGGFTGSAGDLGTHINMHVGIVYGGGIGGGGGYGKHTLTLTGLTPGAHVTVVCDRVRLSRARAGFSDNCGISVNGGTGVTPADGDGPVSIDATANGSGELTITLGHFDLEFGMTGMAMTFGRIRVYGAGGTESARVITGLLADSDGRWAGVNRKASWYESTDNGSTWTLVFAGWLTQATLTGGIEWALHIGDSDRRERQVTAFTSLPSATGFSGQRLIGTPFAPSQNVAAHYPAAWRFKVEKTSDTDAGLAGIGPDYVQLDFQSGWMPNHVDEDIVFREGSIHDDVVGWIIRASDPFLAENLGPGFFALRGLTATVTTTDGVVLSGYTPVAGHSFALSSIISFSDRIWMRKSGALPSVGTLLDVVVAIDGVSDQSPVWWQGHPVDLVAGLLTEAGLAYDATSAATVKAALGALYAQYRFTKTEALWDLIERVAFGPCGFALRRNTAWEWEFFETRTIPSSEPSETIDENAMYDPERAIFDLGVDSQVTAVVWKLINWVIGNATSTDAPMDRAQAQTVTANYQGALGDATIYGDHQVVYDLPGTIVLLEGEAPAQTANIYHQSQSEIILTRWGRGVPSSEIATLRASGIDAKLGEFVVVDLDHKPTIDTGATPSGVRGGARICQVVHRTRDPAGPVLQLLDVGTATTNALVPAFTLAQKTGDTRHTAQLTLTNDTDLTGYLVEVQVNTGSSEPTGGTSTPLFAPDAVAHDLPAQLAGSTVWARARVVKADELPGAWSDWDSVALDAVPPVTSLANSAGANDTERVLTWTVGDATLPVRVRWKATADASYLHSITLPAGSNTYTITGIVTGTAMTAAVDHVEVSPFTGDSSDATTTWTAGSTTPTLTAPTNPQGFTDGNGTYGLRVTASVLPSLVVFMQAVETSVGSGTYGTPVEVGSITSEAGASACVITLTRPNDGLRVQLTAHHAKTGYTDSSDTTAVTLDPWETTATVPGEASDAEYVLASAVPASLPNGRQLAGESGVVDLTDAGAGSTLTVGLVAGGVPLAKLAAGTATDGQVATYDSTNGWQPEAGSAVAVTQATDLAPLWSGGLTESIGLVDITTGKLRLEYSTDAGSTWAPLNDTDDTPVVSLEVAGVVRGDWATPDSGFTDATNDVLLRVVVLDADGTATELNERLRIWKNPGGIQSARIGCDVLVAGAFGTDPVIGSVFIEFNAAGTTVTPPPDPEPGDGVDAPPDSLPVARGILAWHIADHADNTYTSIGAGNFRVSTLADLTGNGNDLTDAGAAEGPSEPARPDASVIATQNGRQPVNYSGNGGYSVWPTSLFTGVTEAELWIVVRAAGGDPNSHFNGISWTDGCWDLGPGSGVARWARHDSGTADTGGISEDFGSSTLRDLGDAPGSLAGFRVYNVRAASGQFVAALDGTAFYTDSSNTVAFSSAPGIGQVTKGCNIDICEIVLYSNVLTTDERALVLAALQARWGL